MGHVAFFEIFTIWVDINASNAATEYLSKETNFVTIQHFRENWESFFRLSQNYFMCRFKYVKQ